MNSAELWSNSILDKYFIEFRHATNTIIHINREDADQTIAFCGTPFTLPNLIKSVTIFSLVDRSSFLPPLELDRSMNISIGNSKKLDNVFVLLHLSCVFSFITTKCEYKKLRIMFFAPFRTNIELFLLLWIINVIGQLFQCTIFLLLLCEFQLAGKKSDVIFEIELVQILEKNQKVNRF